MRSKILSFIFLFTCFLLPKMVWASSLSLSPTTGTFTIGSTFNVSVLLDTQGKSINALQMFLSFPPDKLQVVSPSTGQSIIGVWTAPPKYDNLLGTISLEGGIPGGLATSDGIITTITFRVESTGSALIQLQSRSKLYLNDGLATTDVLSQIQDGLYSLELPPPQGPIVSSDTEPNQSSWYSNNTVVLRWANNFPVDGYSYVLDNQPGTNPQNISNGNRTAVTYSNVDDGIHYFHIKALRNGVWGGVTHFAIKTDTTPPAAFPISISPSQYTTDTKPVIQFTTTDASSGIDHYEMKLEPLSADALQGYLQGQKDNFFIEVLSPFIAPNLPIGDYDVIVRAYDRAGNYQETTERLIITNPAFKFISDEGIIINDVVVIPWLVIWFIGLSLLLTLTYVAFKVKAWHQIIRKFNEEKELPADVRASLEELKEYRKKYGAKIVAVVFILMSCLSFGIKARADTLQLSPPVIDTVSKDISDKDIFYVGGKEDEANGTIVIYLQNLLTGETQSLTTVSDQNGNWFYRYTGFLSPGNYLLWAQNESGQTFSPPSPQVNMSVKQTAVAFGSNRLSYEAIYLFMIILLSLGIIGLIIFIIFHTYHGRRKHQEFMAEVKKAEDSIRLGFAILQRDIANELALVQKTQLAAPMSAEDKEKEAALLKDLEVISKRIGQEVEEIEKFDKNTE